VESRRPRIARPARPPLPSVKPATLSGLGAKNKLGPELNGLVGRKVGTAAGYQYSTASKNADFAWDQTSFAAFIADPKEKIPGNKMVFAGIKDQTEVASLWAYLSRFDVDGRSK
jgi:cytochrome c